MTKDKLIAALEKADAQSQHLVLEDAVKFAHEQRWIDLETVRQALAWIACGAFTDAAMILVSEGFEWTVGSNEGTGWAEVYHPNHAGRTSEGVEAATPAIALAIAALRARDD